MQKKTILIFIFTLLITACGNAENTNAQPTDDPASTIVVTLTPDPCIEPTLSIETGKVNALMREFDDYSTLASNTPQAQLVTVIPELQRVLREAEDQIIPTCLTNLKKLQIEHMQIVVQTLLAFMGNSINTELVNAGIARSRELHLQYDLELARLLGITLQVSASPGATNASVPTTAPTSPIVTNPGPNEINLWSAPDFNAPVSGILAIQATAIALGRTTDNQWIKVEVPNQPGVTSWVIASVAQLSIPIEQLPIATP
jgi:hypothetical protein